MKARSRSWRAAAVAAWLAAAWLAADHAVGSAAGPSKEAPLLQERAPVVPRLQKSFPASGAVKQRPRHRDRAVTADDFRQLAPRSPGATVQRAPRPEPSNEPKDD